MFKIEKISSASLQKAKTFLLSVPSIKEIDEDILQKATLVTDEDDIVGAISYETYNDLGLIRYFVFKKILDDSLIDDLFSNMEFNARADGIKEIFCIVNDKTIENLFSSLGFKQVEKENLYIDEEPFLMHEYKNSNVMIKNIMDVMS